MAWVRVNLTGTRQQPQDSDQDRGIWLDILVELFECNTNQVVVVVHRQSSLVEISRLEDSRCKSTPEVYFISS